MLSIQLDSFDTPIENKQINIDTSLSIKHPRNLNDTFIMYIIIKSHANLAGVLGLILIFLNFLRVTEITPRLYLKNKFVNGFLF